MDGKTIFGFFELFHGDKKDINKFIKPFLDLAPDSQAVYEFLQNSYDAEANIFAFLVEQEYLFVFNNGHKFTFEGIRSILNIGQSTKESKSNIGKFGIGFKIIHRLLGESDGQKELNDYLGPIIFSWSKYQDIKKLADFLDSPIISTETPLFTYNNQDKVYVESDNNPWLFKILFTNFPLGYQENFYDLNYQEKNNMFSHQDLIDLSTLTRKFLFDSGKFSEVELNEGTIIFLKLGANKSSNILSDTAKTTIHRSLYFLNKSNTGHKSLDKIYMQSLDNSVSTSKYEIESFIITKSDRDYEVILADAAEPDKPDVIEIMVQYPKDYHDLSLKSEPNLYLYFPMNEEYLQLNFAIHCNAFHNQSSRTGIDFNSPRNINILKTLCNRLISQLNKLKGDDPHRYCLIFDAIICSDSTNSKNKSWAVNYIYNPLMRYCRTNIPSSEGNYFSKERIRIKKPLFLLSLPILA